MSDNKKIFDSLKDAGSAAFDVAKDFGGRLQEERAQHAHGAEAKSPYGASGKEGLVDKATATAKEFGATVKKAADGTRESAAFDAAKGKFSTAIVGVFIPVFAWAGAIRLARPHSAWARRRYAPAKTEKARARAKSFDDRWGRWGLSIGDLIAGKPNDPTSVVAPSLEASAPADPGPIHPTDERQLD